MARSAGFSLVGTIMAVVVALALVLVFVTGGAGLFGEKAPARKDGVGRTIVGTSRAAAQDSACRSNLSQVRMAIQIASASGEDSRPESLASLKLSDSMLKCAVGGEPYIYNAADGTVRCPHLGHERY